MTTLHDSAGVTTPTRLPELPALPTGVSTNGEAKHAPHHEHPAHLLHHFDNERQQYEASKFGMWLFLATELLFFGGLFVLYAVYRGNNPALFQYGAQFLSTTLGAVNTVVLILSSLTMAFAVRYAQLRHKRGLAIALGLTLLGGGIFMGVKYFEYRHKFEHGLVWGVGYYGAEASAAAVIVDDEHLFAPRPAAAVAGDPTAGRNRWMATCLACHGAKGEGMPGQAFDVRGSEFILDQTDQQLVDFIKRGRMPFDPANKTGIQMPPKGGNPMLKDGELLDIVAYMRTFAPPADAPPEGEVAVDEAVDRDDSAATKLELLILRSSIPPAREAPRGLVAPWERDLKEEARPAGPPDMRTDPDRPANAHMFFNVYFLLTGLHGIHVVIGMGVIGWLLVGALLGRFTGGYFTPVELTGLYWHLVDLIWIFLFPLLYLIN